ncbi:MAG: YhcH/YjgK/YiaL family protein [Acutalibacteraceae bacterium]
MIVDRIENLPLYFSCVPGLDKAADFIEEFMHGEFRDGRYDIEDNSIFANVSSYEPRELNDEMLFEAHREYIDLQLVLRGGERIEWAPLTELHEEREEYSKGGDIAFYSGDAHIPINLAEGEFALLFPGDAHKPCISNGCKNVTKAVIKLRRV